jgi:hypothetical protein
LRCPMTWKIHDHGKVTAEWNEEDKCEMLHHVFSYERIGLYFNTKKGPQNFCDLHMMWGLDAGDRWWDAAYYTKPGDSSMNIDTSRDKVDADYFVGTGDGTRIYYDKMDHANVGPKGFSDRLALSDGGEVIYFGDLRPDAELEREAHTIKDGMKKLSDRIGKKRAVECWMLGPVSLLEGDTLLGSLVAKLEGRFEKDQGFQPCSLWSSHYLQDDTRKGHLGGGSDAPEVEAIRSALAAMKLPNFATGVVWKRDQYETRLSMCQAKALSG